MKKLYLVSMLFMGLQLSSKAQTDSLALTKAFDFWVGDWNATWDKPDGTKGSGSNSIDKTLDGIVIRENFEIPGTGFKGTSNSVFNPNRKSWHQAWADNQGGYFDFIGDFDGDKKIFKTNPIERNGNVIIQRMVFYNITYEAFNWDWEMSTDGGKTWTLNWRIFYTRK